MLLACIPLYALQYSLVPKTGDFGLAVDAVSADAPSVTLHALAVEPNLPAWRAGLRTGDAIVMARMDSQSRVAMMWTLPGDRARVAYERSGRVRFAQLTAVASRPYRFAAPDAIRSAVVFCVFLFALLVTLRAWNTEHGPLIATVLTAFVLNPATDAIPFTARGGIDLFSLWALRLLASVSGFLAPLLAVILAGRLIGWRGAALRISAVCLAVLGVAATLSVSVVLPALQLAGSAGRLADAFGGWSSSAVYAAAAVCLILAYRASQGESRQRLRWMFWGFCPFLLTVAALNLPPLVTLLATNPFAALVVSVVLRLIEISLPVSLFYGVLLRRVVDVGFVFNRVAVYGVLSIVLFAVFVLLEYAASRLFLDTGKFGSLAIQLAIALLIGFSARYSHSVVDRFVDRVLFARRHACESALRRFAREAEAYTSSGALLDRALETVRENSEARGVAIYLTGEEHAAAVRATDGQFPERVDLDDPLLVSLRRWNEPVDTRDSKTAFPDGMVFPIAARGKLLGALACETKRDTSAFAPDERESLREVGHGIALALESLQKTDGQSNVLNAIGELARRVDELIGALEPIRQ